MNKVFVSTMCIGAVSVMGGRAATNEVCDATGQLTIISATDDGQHHDTRGPENSIDGDLYSKSR